TSIYASCYRSEVFDGRRVGAAFDTFGESGSLYVTTHPEQSLVRIDPLGKRTTIAGPDQGMVGSTACAFGTAPDDQTCAEQSVGVERLPVRGDANCMADGIETPGRFAEQLRLDAVFRDLTRSFSSRGDRQRVGGSI